MASASLHTHIYSKYYNQIVVAMEGRMFSLQHSFDVDLRLEPQGKTGQWISGNFTALSSCGGSSWNDCLHTVTILHVTCGLRICEIIV